MKRLGKSFNLFVLICGIVVCLESAWASTNRDADSEKRVKAEFMNLQVPFVKNDGQFDSRVRYFAPTAAGPVFVEDDIITYCVPAPKFHKAYSIKERFLKSRQGRAEGLNPARAKVNLLKGGRGAWKGNISSFEAVSLGEIYKNITLELRAHNRSVEKIFTVMSGGDPGDIAVRIQGARKIQCDKSGNLTITTALGNLRMSAPIAYQEVAGQRISVPVAYKVTGKDTYCFKTGPYDRSLPLIIDPMLASTYLGDSDTEVIRAIVKGASNSIYVAGWTKSYYFPVTEGVVSEFLAGGTDVFISKLDASNTLQLTTLEASTFLGGSADDYAYGMTIYTDMEDDEHLLLTGVTRSNDFPITPEAFDVDFNGVQDIFIAKLNDSLDTLEASTFLGGTGYDYAYTLAVNPDAGVVFVGGSTLSADFPITMNTAYDVCLTGAGDAIVARFDLGLKVLQRCTFLGGSLLETVYGMVISDSAVWVTGETTSKDFPTSPGAYSRQAKGGKDVFVSQFATDLNALRRSTLVGGSYDESPSAIARYYDGISGHIYVTGYTKSANFPVKLKSYSRKLMGSEDAFIFRMNDSLGLLEASTLLGGKGSDFATSIALSSDQPPYVYVSGHTKSTDFPATGGAYATNSQGDYDVFVSMLNASLTTLAASTYVGNTKEDLAYGMVLDSEGVFVAGSTKSNFLPPATGLQGPYQGAFGGAVDGLLFYISNDLSEN